VNKFFKMFPIQQGRNSSNYYLRRLADLQPNEWYVLAVEKISPKKFKNINATYAAVGFLARIFVRTTASQQIKIAACFYCCHARESPRDQLVSEMFNKQPQQLTRSSIYYT